MEWLAEGCRCAPSSGTTTLFAALDVLDGTVIGRCMQRHRHQEFIRFLNTVERRCRPERSSYDPQQLCRPQAPEGARLAQPPPALDLPLHPTSASWLNAVEGFFAKLSKQRLRRGVFGSLVAVHAAIKRFIAESNGHPKPFVWTADADRIIQAATRGHQALDSIH